MDAGSAPAEDNSIDAEFDDSEFPDDASNAPSDETDPATTTITIRDRDLNSWLALNALAVADEIGPEMSAPRFQFQDGRITGGLQLNLPPYYGVLAGEVVPVVVDRDHFELHLVGFRVGQLSIPMQQLNAKVSANGLPPGITLKGKTPPPRLVFEWPQMQGIASGITNVEIGDGELTLTLEPFPGLVEDGDREHDKTFDGDGTPSE